MTEATLEAAPVVTRRAYTVAVEDLLWLGLGALFLGLRIAPALHGPVGGGELVHLSGAWQARIGVADDRFVATLYQALTAGLLHWTTGETLPRLFAFVATATIPAALYILRDRLTPPGALLALLLVCLDGPAIILGSSASAMGFDLPLVVWLFVALTRRSLGGWPVALAGFAAATGGPLVLPLIAGWVAVRLLRNEYPRPREAVMCAGAVIAGIVAATVRFGLGIDGGLRIPAFQLFADGYPQAWETATAFELTLLYSSPLVVAGLAAAAVAGYRMFRAREAQRDGLVLLAWAGFALLWLLSSGDAHTSVPLVALTTPLALILGPALVEAVSATWRADWYYARWLVPMALLAACVGLAFSLDWARDSRLGDGREQLLVGGLCLIAVSALGIVASARESRPAVFAAMLGAALFPVLSGAFGIGFRVGEEPAVSPFVPQQARQLRDIALQTARDRGGLLVVHSDLQDLATWSFRDSGTIVAASRVPPDATLLVWPKAAPPPDGYQPLAGDWQLLRELEPPTSGFLAYLKWFSSRNSLAAHGRDVAVYLKASR